MTLTGLLLGVINVAIVVAILVLVGALVVWFCSLMSIAVPEQVRRIFLIVCALIGLYMLAALLLGIPTIHIISAAKAQQVDTLPVEDVRVCDKHERLICPVFSERCFCRPIGGWDAVSEPDTGYGEHESGGGSTVVPPSDEAEPK